MIKITVRSAAGQAESLESLEDLPADWRESGDRVWVDLIDGNPQEIEALQKAFELHPATFVDCELCGQRPRLDLTESAVFVLWYPLIHSISDSNPMLTTKALRFYFGANFLLTLHQEPINTLDHLTDLMRSRSNSTELTANPSFSARLLDLIIDEYLLASEIFDNQLEAMEEESLEMKGQTTLLDRMRRLRRPLLQFHQLLERHSMLLSHLLDCASNHLSTADEATLKHSQYHLKLATDLARRNRDSIAVIQENINSSLSNRMNAIMKTLTLFASLMLPLSFVVGFYGMNLPLWPDPQEPQSLIWITSGMAGITTLLLLFFWWRRWF